MERVLRGCWIGISVAEGEGECELGGYGVFWVLVNAGDMVIAES